MISSLRNIFRRNSQSASRDVSTRVDYNDLLRRKKREEAHSKFRKLLPKCENLTCDKRLAKELIKGLRNNSNVNQQLETAKKVREISIDNHLMVDYLLKLDLLVVAKEMLLLSKSIELQHEGVWICANISIDNTEDVLKSGVQIPLMNLMKTPELTEGCLWAFANISSESKETRDLLLQQGILFHVSTLSHHRLPIKIHQQITSVLLNFAKFSGLSKEVVVQVLGVFSKYLQCDDFEAVYNSLCAITFLISDAENIKPVVCSGTIPVLVKLLASKNVACEQMAANLLKRLAENIDEECLNNVLTVMPKVLEGQRAKSIRDILRFITTIVESEDSELWKKVLGNEELLVKVIGLVKDGNVGVAESSLELLFELALRGEDEDIKRLVNKGLLESLCNILKQDLMPDVLKLDLKLLHMMLSKAEGYLNYMKFQIEECGGKDDLETLMLHYNQTVADISIDITEKFFNDNDSFLFKPLSPVDVSFINDLNPSGEFCF